MTPEQKFVAVAKTVLSAFAIFVFLCIVASLLGLIKIEAVNYVYEGVWSRGLNIFALTRCIITLLLVLVGAGAYTFVRRKWNEEKEKPREFVHYENHTREGTLTPEERRDLVG